MATRPVDAVVEAGLVRQPQRLLQDVLGMALEGGQEEEVAEARVVLVAVLAEVDEVLHVVVGADVLHVLREEHRDGWRAVVHVNCCVSVSHTLY